MNVIEVNTILTILIRRMLSKDSLAVASDVISFKEVGNVNILTLDSTKLSHDVLIDMYGNRAEYVYMFSLAFLEVVGNRLTVTTNIENWVNYLAYFNGITIQFTGSLDIYCNIYFLNLTSCRIHIFDYDKEDIKIVHF